MVCELPDSAWVSTTEPFRLEVGAVPLSDKVSMLPLTVTFSQGDLSVTNHTCAAPSFVEVTAKFEEVDVDERAAVVGEALNAYTGFGRFPCAV